MKRRRIKVHGETVRLLAVELQQVRGGAACSDPTCQICDTIKPQPGCC